MKWILLLLITASTPAWAFDRLKCQSQLTSWTVHNAPKGKPALLTGKFEGITLSRKDSHEFIVRNEKGTPMASIAPWNSVLYLQSKSAKAGKFKMDFKTDDKTYFSLSMKNPDGSNHQDFNCQFSF